MTMERSNTETPALVAGEPEATREGVLAAALERRIREVDRLQRESDALRAELAVRDGYVADLRRRLVDAERATQTAQREVTRLLERDAEAVHGLYVRLALDEARIKQRLEEAIVQVARLKDQERAAALGVLRAMLADRPDGGPTPR